MEPERGYRLLVVDDDGVDRQRYSRLLGHKAPGAFEILPAADGMTGLSILRSQPDLRGVDCVLLDYQLPDMNGLEFLASCEAEGELPFAVVLVTGRGNESIAVEAMKRGAQDYLVKDQVNENSLWRAITRAVTQKELRLRLASSLHQLRRANALLEQQVAMREATEIELRTAKLAAEQANLAKTRFVAMVTHELRTPLNGILGYAHLLRIEGGLSDTQSQRVAAMTVAGQHLRGMIEQVLDFASFETGHVPLEPRTVAVASLARDCIDVVAPMAAERILTLGMQVDPGTPSWIVLDPARLQQILLNLMGNAVKFTPSGGVVLRLAPGATPGGLRIEVVDTGQGIAADKVGLLFQDFERVGATASVEGAGLGLSIVARIVATMGGRVGHAPNPQGGSIFWVDLPTAEPAPSHPPAPSQPAPRHAGRVLLVDDIAMNRDVIGAFLQTEGHTVLLAGSGEDAVRRASEGGLDLVLMDVRMPGMDGFEATRRIRALPGLAGMVPILGLTAYSCRGLVRRCQDAGMEGHMTKPIDPVALLRRVDELIAAGIGPLEPPVAPQGQDADPDADQDGADTEAGGDEAANLPFDRPTFERTMGFVPAEAQRAALQSLLDRTAETIAALDSNATLAMRVELAHGLASVAGMFGLLKLSAASRSFEAHAADASDTVHDVARALRMEAEAACHLLGSMIHSRETASP